MGGATDGEDERRLKKRVGRSLGGERRKAAVGREQSTRKRRVELAGWLAGLCDGKFVKLGKKKKNTTTFVLLTGQRGRTATTGGRHKHYGKREEGGEGPLDKDRPTHAYCRLGIRKGRRRERETGRGKGGGGNPP